MEINSIKVGDSATYKQLNVGVNGYSIWAKTRPDGVQSWIVAKEPDPRVKAFVPNSVLQEYESPFQALAALRRWALPPPVPKKPRKVKIATAGSCRRNSQHPKPEKPDPTQLQFDLQDPRRKL